MAKIPSHLMFGAAYYSEYGRGDRLKEDLDLMVEANFNVIRVGESVWSTWEPENGQFDLDWLQPVLDGAHERGLAVIIGTATYAVPPWLARLYPELNGRNGTDSELGWGGRQEVDFTHPGFRFHAERVIRAVMERYAQHRAVIGFQVDNEPGLHLLHNRGVFQRFVDELRREYGDVETLNREWGLVYWSHRLSTWADLWTPDGNEQPQYELAWRRFQARQTEELINWQADIVREYATPDQFVTTCISYERPAIDDTRLSAALDVASGNPYYRMQDGLQLPDSRRPVQRWQTDGTWALFETADRMYASRQEQFLVMETNATSIGFSWDNRPAYDGQWRQAAWALLGRGARMVEYWHMHTLPFGAETYWSGVLPHSGRPGRAYRELARVGSEMAAVGTTFEGFVPDFDVTLLYSTPTKWLMNTFPELDLPDGSPDPHAYRGIVDPFYRGAFDAGFQVRVKHADQLVATRNGPGMAPAAAAAEHPVLVVAGFYIADEESLRWLNAYVEEGGHLILGPRSGYADREARARTEPAPAALIAAAGVSYEESSNVSGNVRVTGSSALPLTGESFATRWIDGLEVGGADVLATYEHPHFKQWPAVTKNRHGSGTVTCVGTVPNQELARAVFSTLDCEPASGWSEIPETVTITSGTVPDGRRVYMVHNWSWDEVTVRLPRRLVDLIDPTVEIPLDGGIGLGPWDVRVLVTEVGP